MNNRKSQKGVIDTNNRPLSKKSDARIQQKPQQRQQQLHHQPKAHGGDDDTPSGGSARHTHNRFAVAASNPCGAKSTQSYHTVKSNLESDGNRRPTRAPAARQIGGISKVERKDEERRTNRSNGTYREPNDEILKITKQIKKLFNNIRDGTKDKNVKEEVFRNEPDSSEDMLKCIEWYFRQYQQEIERYQQGKKNVEAEIVKLAKDVIDADAGIEKEIHEQIISIRLQMEQQKRTYLERYPLSTVMVVVMFIIFRKSY